MAPRLLVKEPLLMISEKTEPTQAESPIITSHSNRIGIYRVYTERWLVLGVCCLLALSSAMQWIGYASLTDQSEIYYRNKLINETSDYTVAWATNQIFQFVAVLTGVGGMYITDNYGILCAALIGTSLNMFGSLVRLGASLPLITSFLARELVLHAGSIVVAAAQAFFLVLPSKIAECWFADNQRAVANVLSFIANPGGVALGTIVPSLLFGNDTSSFSPESWTFFIYGAGMSLLALLPFVMSLFMRRSVPKTPPSASSASASHQKPMPFWTSIIFCLSNIQFLVQMMVFALAFALLWSVLMFVVDVLYLQGYTLQGYPVAFAAIIGTLTSLLCGHIADKTKKFKEIIRVCSIGFCLSVIALRFFLTKKNESVADSIIIFVIVGAMGAFSIPQFPIGVEMGVETTFPVLEATSSGLLVIFGQLWMFNISWIFADISKTDWFYQVEKNVNWKLTIDVCIAFSLLSVVLSTVFMNPRYLRLEMESSTLAGTTSRTTESELHERRSNPDSEIESQAEF
ncbi:unnamed protein product [Caenorhabditis auriculariae]|uniref:Major facilitator superfamily (MFS) profile domain-containing protein n=1 Tax=Caenorhabditis auriculariae TaxID=2777116 RepID=A0A8S1H462_9PELO|nr:unnamed protein product [Caenorhabditis auriculariae]